MRISSYCLASSAAFTGAALYVSLVDHPTRLQLDTAAALKQWKKSYSWSMPLQAGLALSSGILAFVNIVEAKEHVWTLGSALMLANWPLTLIFILPLQKRLMAINEASADEKTRAGLERWGHLHGMCAALGLWPPAFSWLAVL
ncbi:hypothetical protein niasHT_038812 [Heterodera trifolii]|uniref:DUF1772-domain-containing protein n=1 Tax=Heterodera trifolii TaxID=157864 RepID=A0ABD2IAM1_9BILA